MSDVDFGLILGSTNEEIWNDEVAKTAGTRALAKAMSCSSPQCPLTRRQHLQKMFDAPGALEAAAELLAAHEHETPDELRNRLFSAFEPAQADDDDELDVEGMMRVEPQADGSTKVFMPDGEEVPYDTLPPIMRQIIEHATKTLMGDDDDETPTVPKHLH